MNLDKHVAKWRKLVLKTKQNISSDCHAKKNFNNRNEY